MGIPSIAADDEDRGRPVDRRSWCDRDGVDASREAAMHTNVPVLGRMRATLLFDGDGGRKSAIAQFHRTGPVRTSS